MPSNITTQELKRYRGDSAALSIALTDPDTGSSFNPTGSVLIFTVKNAASDLDAAALVQKISNVGGITVASPSVVSLVPADHAALPARITFEWDIQAQHTVNGTVKTVARGTLYFFDDVTKNLTISIPTEIVEPSSEYLNAEQLLAARDEAVDAAESAAAAAEQTADDRDQTTSDREHTEDDREATAADRVATGEDAADTAADRVQTGLDRIATGEDSDATAADRSAVATDRGLAQTAAITATTGAATATTKAAEAVAAAGTAVAISGPVRNALGAAGSRYFQGTGRVRHDLTGYAIGYDDTGYTAFLDVPAANPSAVMGVMALSSSNSTMAQANALVAEIDTSRNLRTRLYGATTGDYKQALVSLASFGGTAIFLHVQRAGATLTVRVNGVIQSLTESSLGTDPTWAGSITNTWFTVGTAFIGRMWGWAWWNCALDASDSLSLFNDAGVPQYKHQWGSETNLIPTPTTFSGWSPTNLSVGTGVTDPFGGTSAVSFTPSTTDASITYNPGTVFVSAPGKAVKYDLWMRSQSGTASLLVRIPFVTPGAATTTLVGLTSAGTQQFTASFSGTAWVNKSATYVHNGATGSFTADYYSFGQSGSYGTGDGVIEVMPVMRQIGALVYCPANDGIGFQDHDLGPYKLDGVATTSGINHTLPVRRGYVRTPGAGLSWSGTHEAKSMLGIAQRALPNGVTPEAITTKATVASSGSGLTLGATGSAARWVAANVFTTAKKRHTRANDFAGGTTDNDNDLLLDPDTANYTGVIAAEFHYTVTEGNP